MQGAAVDAVRANWWCRRCRASVPGPHLSRNLFHEFILSPVYLELVIGLFSSYSQDQIPIGAASLATFSFIKKHIIGLGLKFL